jgi:hypothetical protein
MERAGAMNALARLAASASSTELGLEPRKPPKPRRWVALALIAGTAALIFVIRCTPWGGPMLADGLRSVVGDRSVTWLEERWAALEDLWMRTTHFRTGPRRLRDVSPEPLPLPPPDVERFVTEHAPTTSSPEAPASTAPELNVEFRPPAPGTPPFVNVAAADDGRWYPVWDPNEPAAPAFAYRTLIHPDPDRTFAEVFVVALPVRLISLHLVAGTLEPESNNPEVQRLDPRGLIPEPDEPALLAAFNGGFKTRHGHHGMFVGGVEIVPLQAGLCTIRGSGEGELEIATWSRADSMDPEAWYRQTPPCMLERGVMHPGLVNPDSRKWGATLDGETVIRRSALALDRTGEVAFVGVSNATTARALAIGMQSAGAWTVAQLDVNWSYPRFLVFPKDASGTRRAATLFSGFLFERDEMLRQASPRDFFYVTRRGAPQPLVTHPTEMGQKRAPTAER